MSTTARPILHHYPASPFSEKVRVGLGIKGLAYGSVRVPVIMPKPDVIALTGGYRRTPVLQVGSHVFCDTPRILRALEQLVATPPLFAHPAGECVAQWADSALFDVAVALTKRPSKLDTVVSLMTPDELQGFAADREKMREGAPRQLMGSKVGAMHLPEYLRRIDRMAAAGPYLLGSEPGIADLAVYHNLWFIDMLSPERLPGDGPVRAWMARMAAFGHGAPEPCEAEAALAICREHDGSEWPTPEHAPLAHVELGQQVAVRPDDWGRDAVEGELVESDAEELVVRRSDPRTGTVHVHFARVGFEIQPLSR